MNEEVTIDSYSKAKLWGIVQQQGRIVGVIAQTLLSSKSDREVRGALIELLVTCGAIRAQEPTPAADAPKLEIVKA